LVIPAEFFLYLGLSLGALSTGLVMPNIYDLLGKLYQKTDAGRDSAFTIAYTGMNLGALVGLMSAGFVMRYLGYTAVFLVSAAAFFIAVIFFMLKMALFPSQKKSIINMIYTLAIVVLTIIVIFGMLHISFVSRELIVGIGILILSSILILAYKNTKINPLKSRKLVIFVLLSLISISFWSLYMLQSTMLVVFFDRNVNREIAGFIMPAASILSFNPIFMLILGPLMSLWWLRQSKQNKITHPSSKFTAGIIALGLAFGCLAFGIRFVGLHGYIALIWVILFFVFLSIGEMIFAPAGYAMIGVLIEDNLHSVALGVWQLITGIGVAISGNLAELANIPKAASLPPTATNHLYMTNFTLFAVAAIAIGLLALGLVRFQRKTEL
jgi:amino acid/peptide:H+ symporter